jgi:hypothetical protein
MAAQGTTDEPHDAPHGAAAILGDGPEIFGDLELAHEVSSGFDVQYVLFPLGIPRPTTGWTRTIVTCGHCGYQMWCTVYSISALDRARRRPLKPRRPARSWSRGRPGRDSKAGGSASDPDFVEAATMSIACFVLRHGARRRPVRL